MSNHAFFSSEDWFVPVLFAWIALVAFASLGYRTSHGKKIWPDVPSNAKFVERWTSGRSLDTWWKKMGGANNRLCVVVTTDALTICPQFPFTLLFMPEIYGMDISVSLDQVKAATPRRWFFRAVICIEYRDEHGQSRAFELRLRKPDDFLRALDMPVNRAIGS